MSSHSQHHQSPPEWHSTSLLSKSVLELRAALSSARQDSLPVVDNGGVPVPDSKEEDVESQLLSQHENTTAPTQLPSRNVSTPKDGSGFVEGEPDWVVVTERDINSDEQSGECSVHVDVTSGWGLWKQTVLEVKGDLGDCVCNRQ